MDTTELHERFKNLSKPLEPRDTGTIPALQHLRNIRIIAYDFYGTIFLSGVGDIGIDDGEADRNLITDSLEGAGIEILSNDAGTQGFEIYNRVVESHIGKLKEEGIEYPEPDIRKVWNEILTKMESEELINLPDEKSVEEIVSVEFEVRMNPVWPSPHALEVMKFFKEKEVPQGIISNSQFYTPIVLEALTEHSLEELGFEKKLLHWSYEAGEKKPGMSFYEGFVEKLKNFDSDLSPENVLYIGNDMLKDIYPAHELGMKTALFAGDERSLKWRKDDERCSGIQPDIIITSLDQLKDCVSV